MPHLQFQGDSITQHDRDFSEPQGDRNLGSGYVSRVASTLQLRRPELRWSFTNRGISGHRITDLAQRWQNETLAVRPDVLSLLIGTNDVWNAFKKDHPPPIGIAEFGEIYGRLLDDLLRARPDARIILAEPFVIRGSGYLDAFAEALAERSAWIRSFAGRRGLPCIDYQQALDRALARGFTVEDLAPDAIHPTRLGHALLAETWLEAFTKAYPEFA
jgi:lysophospholipase L1-like esterase